jgi:CDP-4-dehydro-6-deoxyglucose reductase, E1
MSSTTETVVSNSKKARGDRAQELKAQILALVSEYHEVAHTPTPFEAGQSIIPVSGKVYGASEMQHLVESGLDFWLTTGRFNSAFEERLRTFLGRRFALTVNSGSSANLVAVSALCSPMLKNPLRPGDEVITCATGFPTTVNPLIQNGLIPVFIDVGLPTYNILSERIEAAITDRTRAIVLAHTLGNPFDLATVMELAQKHNLYVVEDSCDALGATYDNKLVGTFGDVGTVSFYPAHHITMGEGGAVFADDGIIKRILESIRDWGRDCYCEPGTDNTCKRRFGWKLGDLPRGYDHKYTYSNIGYNLKITDMQAAVGLAQMDRLEDFIEIRRQNFTYLHEELAKLQDKVILPEATPRSNPSWFGFPITVREDAGFERDDLVAYLNEHKVHTRLLFGGNLIKQPYFKRYVAGRDYKIFGDLTNSDVVMNSTFWIGVYPGLTEEHLHYTVKTITEFVQR